MRLFFLIFAFQAVEASCSHLLNSLLIQPRTVTSLPASNPKFHQSQTILPQSSIPTSLVTLRGGGVDGETVAAAYGWCINLGAPAALVAGAVVATLYENVRGGALEVQKGDSTYVRVAKTLTGMMLLSSFALQIVSIFITTVMGTMLLSRDFSDLKTTSTTALAFLREHFEFEYLTSRISFLQGLLNWIAGVALEHSIPRKGEGSKARKLDRFVSISLTTLIVLLLSFYNSHMTFYDNYFEMLSRWFHVTRKRFFTYYRPLMWFYIPGVIGSFYTCGLALMPDVMGYSEERAEA
jgi:hypothetical protein